MWRECTNPFCAHRLRGMGQGQWLVSRGRIRCPDHTLSLCDLCLNRMVMGEEDFAPSLRRVAGTPQEFNLFSCRHPAKLEVASTFRIRMPAVA
jgi:hypothetical protein